MDDGTPASWEEAVAGGLLDDESEEEEAFVEQRRADSTELLDDNEGLPVLLVDLTALAAEAGQSDLQTVRQVVVQTLDTGFISRSDDLFASGHCRHSERWRSLDDRRRMEDERGGAVVTVISYPANIDGAPLGLFWRSVRSPSAWEVVDELKEAIASCNRSIKCGAERVQTYTAGAKWETPPFEGAPARPPPGI